MRGMIFTLRRLERTTQSWGVIGTLIMLPVFVLAAILTFSGIGFVIFAAPVMTVWWSVHGNYIGAAIVGSIALVELCLAVGAIVPRKEHHHGN